MNILLLSTLALVSADKFLELPIFRALTRVAIPAKDGSDGVHFNRESLYANITVREVPYTTHLEPESGDVWIFENDQVSDRRAPSGEYLEFMGREFEFGMYYMDNVTFDKANFKMPYAIINKELNLGESNTGGLGLGPKGAPTFKYLMENLGERQWYANFADHVKNSGLAASDAFSINLATNPSEQDKLVYGAMDVSRFNGKLKPIYKSRETKLINAEFTIGGISTNAGLDIENPNTYLDDEVVAAVAKKLGAEWDEKYGLYVINDKPQDDLILNFGEVEIKVPAEDVWVQDKQVSEKWYFTIRPRSSYTLLPKTATLGADILRSTYIVYDLGRNYAAIGQVNRNPGPPDYEVIYNYIHIFYLTEPLRKVPI